MYTVDSEILMQKILDKLENDRIEFAQSNAIKPKTAPTHPKVSEMVNNAIRSLKERGGSSLQAIKKYMAANYKLDINRMTPFIRKYLKSAVANGELIQTKGKGSSGSFKLGVLGQKMKKLSKAKEDGFPAKVKLSAEKADEKKPAAKKAANPESGEDAKPSKPQTSKVK